MKQMFGSNTSNFWRGLEGISALTTYPIWNLVVTIEANISNVALTYVNTYSLFNVGSFSTGYKLMIGGFSTMGPSFDAFKPINGSTFATTDYAKNPSLSGCAAAQGGAWWYNADTCIANKATPTCNACLNQSPVAKYIWSLGFSTDQLISDNMALVCKTT